MRGVNDISYIAAEDACLVPKHAPSPVSELEGLSASSRGSKYKPVWQRAFGKVKAKLQLLHLGRDIQIYGASTLGAVAGTNDLLPAALVKKTLLAAEKREDRGWLFKPRGQFLTLWSWLFSALMLYVSFVVPYRTAFHDDPEDSSWAIMDWVINVFFSLDIAVTLNTPLKIKGKLTLKRWDIFLAYLKSWLLLDIVACLPFNLIPSAPSSTSSNQLSRLLRLIRLPRLYRLLRLTRMLKMLRDEHGSNACLDKVQSCFSIKQSVLKFIFFILSIVLVLHLMGCAWFLVAIVEGLTPDTWVAMENLIDADPADQYVAAVYWSVTTLATVGYGDIVPGTSAERVVSIIWMIFGLCFFSFTVSSLTSMLHSIDTKESLLASKLSAIDEFSEESKLSKDLNERLRLALRFSTQRSGFSTQLKRSIFNELPRELRYQVALAMHQGSAKTIPFFQARDQAFIAAIVPFLNSLQMGEKAEVYQAGEYSDEIYFISKGHCLYMYHDLVMKKLQNGSYFGETEVMTDIPRRYTVLCAVNSKLLTMGRKLLRVIEQDFPTVFDEMKQIADIRRKLETKMCVKLIELFNFQPLSPDLQPNSPFLNPLSPMLPPRRPSQLPKTTPREAYEKAEKCLCDLEGTVRQIKSILNHILCRLPLSAKVAPSTSDY